MPDTHRPYCTLECRHSLWEPHPEGSPTMPDTLVCALCLFVGDSDDPTPVTIINGNLTCEPHGGYFQCDAHVFQAIIAWRREHPYDRGAARCTPREPHDA